jgi:alkanesulfonate monooxygenase SsuD/methylene tetrahydromethanopterin reductase-like flavin-dependent oxidoreductase (luciferase family)
MDILAQGPAAAAATLARVADAGLDHVACGDHVSFLGVGFDGLVQATALLTLHPTLAVHTGIYLLPLRHPVLVARQLADIGRLAPGRLVFGVGLGGEDRREVLMCGVDPTTRGVRMNECLTVIRQLLTGEPTTFQGRHVRLEEAVIAPAPSPPIPLVVGGRSEVAVKRAGRLGDGWLGIWVSPRRFGEATAQAGEEAARAGRADPAHHAMQVWCGMARTAEAARAVLAPAMQGFYGLPFEQFERYCPYGRPEDVAAFLAPYVDAGCTSFNLITQSPDADAAIAYTGEVKRHLG